jgi:2,4-dienoyl-CoA reductase-like NADH-dependent reductase (Old Yellow Enzyme family)
MVMRGWGSIMVEATAIVPEGRITPEDSVSITNPFLPASHTRLTLQGIWDDSHIPGFKRIVDFVHAHRGKIGIQLAHAGRKASTLAPWVERMARDEGWTGGSVASEQYGGWPKGGESSLFG